MSLLTQVLLEAGDSTKSIFSPTPRSLLCPPGPEGLHVQRSVSQFYSPDQAIGDTSVNTSQSLYGSSWRFPNKESNAIHTWVAENINHKINQLLGSLPTDTSLILLNAAYLSAK